MSTPVLTIEKKDQIALLTLNRPQSMNALSTELRNCIEAAFADLKSDSSIRVAILTGAGRAFCAGLDLKELADTHARVGVIPGSELSQKLSRLLGIYRAKEVPLTGNFIDAQQAMAWGLVNRVVPPEELLPTCYRIAEDIISCPQDMIIKYKKLIDDGFQMAFGDALELERKTNYEHFQTVQAETIAERRADVINRGREQT